MKQFITKAGVSRTNLGNLRSVESTQQPNP